MIPSVDVTLRPSEAFLNSLSNPLKFYRGPVIDSDPICSGPLCQVPRLGLHGVMCLARFQSAK